MPQKPCLERKCKRLHRNPSGRCDECEETKNAEAEQERLEREPWRAAYRDPRWATCLREAKARDGGQCRALLYSGVRCPEVTGLEGHHTIPLAELWATGQTNRAFDYRIVLTLCRGHHAQADAQLRSR